MTAGDACPGILDLHEARDGLVARIRLPGGYATGRRLHDLATLASRFGDGSVDLTARGNVQLRGVRAGKADDLARRAVSAGLLPSPAHDRARNITASPLAGLAGHPDLRKLVRALDQGVRADPDLAALPGRFLFCLDDGSGRAGLSGCDVGLRLCSRGATHGATHGGQRGGDPITAGPITAGLITADLIVGGRETGLRGPARQVIAQVIEVARAFVTHRQAAPDTVRITGLADGGAAITAAVGGSLGDQVTDMVGRLPLGPAGNTGLLTAGTRPLAAGTAQLRGTARLRDTAPLAAAGLPLPAGTASSAADTAPFAVIAAPLGRLTVAQLRLIGSMIRPGEAGRLTTAARVVLPLAEPVDAGLIRLAEAGLLVSDDHLLSGVTACSGMSCTRSLADVRSRATPVPGLTAVHWAGCSRRCGRPADAAAVVAISADEFTLANGPAGRVLTLADRPAVVAVVPADGSTGPAPTLAAVRG